MFPGEGGLDLVRLTKEMPADIMISIEVPTAALAKTVNAETRARWERAQGERSLGRRWIWLMLAGGAVLAIAFAVREQPVQRTPLGN